MFFTEINNEHWLLFVRNQLIKIFGLSMNQAREVVQEESFDSSNGAITANFPYSPSQSVNTKWNCYFKFDENYSEYNCFTNNGKTRVSGRIEADKQRGILDSLTKAKNEIISKDNELFRG